LLNIAEDITLSAWFGEADKRKNAPTVDETGIYFNPVFWRTQLASSNMVIELRTSITKLSSRDFSLVKSSCWSFFTFTRMTIVGNKPGSKI